ncbi:glycoside hydrolase [Coprothermobacteraceae bacterium]|nr:glycoside hydrolase [Coprothermobacteraceae bacterium]
MGKLYLSFIWHNHQPYYKDPFTGKYVMPWVRLHATKDYLDMVLIKNKYPAIKATYNMVPSLVEQLEEYAAGASDAYLDMTLKAAEQLSVEDKRFIISNFFKADFRRKISHFPRYVELYTRRSSEGIDASVATWDAQDFRDLQVLFNLAWIDAIYYDIYEDLARLKEKGRGFDQDDVAKVVEIQKRILEGVLSAYKEALRVHEVDLMFSPYYHPILPLLYSSKLAKRAVPDAALPHLLFSYPEDVKAQLQAGFHKHRALFGQAPEGLWPSEQSVSPEILKAAAEVGIRWVVTDEKILAKTLNMNYFERGYRDVPEHAALLYRPYKVQLEGAEVFAVFRDQILSDLIGFEYAKWSVEAAVSDFVSRLEAIYEKIRGLEGDYLVTVALDGENCWEFYENDGYDFLSRLYEVLSQLDWVKTETVTNFIKDHDNFGLLSTIYTGSWINSNFDIWINDPCKNKAWDYLAAVRMQVEMCFRKGSYSPDIKREVMRHIYIAEGSDWFWWYGKPNEAPDKALFDELFRRNLRYVYHILDEPEPEFLSEPITDGRC